ncbi:MAG: cohesin domain-containing protein [bacterium]
MFIHLKKKLFAVRHVLTTLLYVLVATSASVAFAQPVRFSLPNNAAGTAGETVTIPLQLDPANRAIGSFDATVEFKNTLLTYTGFVAGPTLAADDSWLVDVNGNNANGVITIGAFSFAPVRGPGAAVLLQFIVNATAIGGDTAPLSLHRLAATDTNVTVLPVEGVGGKFTVKPAIFGHIRNAAGAAISSVTLSGLPGNPTTDEQGYYHAAVEPDWIGVVTPSHKSHTFEPPSRQYNQVSRDLSEQDYLGTEILTAPFAFPSPFNPAAATAQIRFTLKNPAQVSIKIFDGSGELVSEFSSLATLRPNMVQSIRWDGRNGRGEMVANGIYFYIIEAAGNARMSGKIGVMR